MWQLPAIWHVCSLLGEAFSGKQRDSLTSLPKFSIEQLETVLTADSEVPDPMLIELHIRLLRPITNIKVGHADWELTLSQLITYHIPHEVNPLIASKHRWLAVQEKVMILYFLCELRLLEADDMRTGGEAQQVINEYDPDSIRMTSIGEDKQANAYWYFAGSRLYREAPAVAKTSHKKKKTQ